MHSQWRKAKFFTGTMPVPVLENENDERIENLLLQIVSLALIRFNCPLESVDLIEISNTFRLYKKC